MFCVASIVISIPATRSIPFVVPEFKVIFPVLKEPPAPVVSTVTSPPTVDISILLLLVLPAPEGCLIVSSRNPVLVIKVRLPIQLSLICLLVPAGVEKRAVVSRLMSASLPIRFIGPPFGPVVVPPPEFSPLDCKVIPPVLVNRLIQPSPYIAPFVCRKVFILVLPFRV